jgi:hypothetical protein
MSAEAATSQFQFEKRRTQAVVGLSTGESIQGSFFTANGITRHEGPERVGDLLNLEPGFFPFEVREESGAKTVMYNRAHVVTVALPNNEASLDPGYGVATRRAVSVLLSTGARLVGGIRVYRPEGRDRVSDWTRQPEVFRYIETDDGTLIVNTAHIVDVSEVTAS